MSKKSAVFTLTNVTDGYLDLYGVKFDAREFSLRETEKFRVALEDEEVRDNPLKQGEIIYNFLESRIQEGYEMFTLDFFLDNTNIAALGKLARFFGTGEVSVRKN